MEEGNIAISIKGNARVCKQQLDATKHCAMIEVDILEVKSDVTRVGSVISGINCEINDRYVELTRNIYNEMMK
jgi:hypothetical protein